VVKNKFLFSTVLAVAFVAFSTQSLTMIYCYSGGYGDSDVDRDGLSGQEELVIGTDPCDPDSDGDGIMDGLDREPLVSSNLCSGDNSILDNQTITSQATCAANSTIAVKSTVAVDSTGDLELIAPSVSIRPGFGVGGQLSVKALSPMPPPE
jgi:hypothetical protein